MRRNARSPASRRGSRATRPPADTGPAGVSLLPVVPPVRTVVHARIRIAVPARRVGAGGGITVVIIRSAIAPVVAVKRRPAAAGYGDHIRDRWRPDFRDGRSGV